MSNPDWLKGKKVAIVTDWLTTYGGAEKVVKTVHEIFPEAPIFTSQYSEKQVNWFKDCDVRVGWMNLFPARLRKILSLPRAIYFNALGKKLSDYDVILSITTAESKGIKTRPDQLHISYLQGPPTQYFWGMYDDYIKNPGFGVFNPIIRFFFRLLIRPLRKIDYILAQRPDFLLANSTYSALETAKYYHRQASVVFPPVETDKFSLRSSKSSSTGDFYISTSRQVNWKRLDIAVEAFKKMDKKLMLVGDGAEHEKLVRLARGASNIEFVPVVSDPRELSDLVRRARGFIFPSFEPFGIAPIEALSAGVPVIAYKNGGALDYIVDGKNGVFFAEQTTSSLMSAVKEAETIDFDKKTISMSSKQFSKNNFMKHYEQFVHEKFLEK